MFSLMKNIVKNKIIHTNKLLPVSYNTFQNNFNLTNKSLNKKFFFNKAYTLLYGKKKVERVKPDINNDHNPETKSTEPNASNTFNIFNADSAKPIDEEILAEEIEELKMRNEINNKSVLEQMEYFNRNAEFDKTLDLFNTILYRETLRDRKHIRIQYKIAKKKLETEYKIIERCLGLSNLFSMGNMLGFILTVFLLYVVLNK